ncbi:sulfatase [Nibricoccus aquaticus]|uniref:Sulfatase n=2 Tax=Nibricoccus aquaticus TaxID=2576891 RepID=A0A290Q7N5_9BACT|nr:sulfatase-like hydrolase/transferase [Nibricoccus aquaticus]ATC63180.1 sulfatase [Nibricoccus aquaticus]
MRRRPNILWVVTTQWRASATGYAGDVNARTPCLAALAKEAVNYEQAVTPHPFGPFARAALLTGVLSPENGVRDYYDPLPVNARTVAHEMNERGYATGFFGKWHLARRDPAAALVGEAHARTIVPVEARGGFEFWEGFESGFLLNDPWLHGARLTEPVKFEGYQSDVVCRRAGEWLRAQTPNAKIQTPKMEAERPTAEGSKPKGAEAKPWFGVVSLEAPHPPYDAPAAGVAVRRPEEILLSANVPRGGEVEAKARRELAGYYAHIEATDRAIERLFAGLKAGGVWEETVVVFTSVHGDMHGAHGLFRKGWPHEEAVRVPLLVKSVGKSEGGRVKSERRREAVSLVDLSAATVACAEGGVFELRAPVGGAQISMPSVVALPHQCDRVWRGVRTAKRKLVLNADGSPWLFFDLESDPGEMRNIVGEAAWAEEIAELRNRNFGQD